MAQYGHFYHISRGLKTVRTLYRFHRRWSVAEGCVQLGTNWSISHVRRSLRHPHNIWRLKEKRSGIKSTYRRRRSDAWPVIPVLRTVTRLSNQPAPPLLCTSPNSSSGRNMENVHLLNSRTPAISASCLELKDILRECSTGKCGKVADFVVSSQWISLYT